MIIVIFSQAIIDIEKFHAISPIPIMEQAPTASTDDHIPLDDHILPVASTSVSTRASEPFPDILDAHLLVGALC